MTTDDEVRRLRKALARHEGGAGKRFRPEIRQRIVMLGRRLRRSGQSWRAIGETLGVTTKTVRRLCGEPAGFAAIEIVDDRAGGLALVTPAGHRLEGLSLVGAVDLLRMLA